jgi:membrane protease YdiL (CAAX protease family)
LNSSEEERGAVAQKSWIEQLAEVSVFLFLIVPSLIFSFFAVKQGGLGFVPLSIFVMLRDLALISLIIFFIHSNREHVRSIGWTFKNARREIVLGILLFIVFFFGAAFLEMFLEAAGLSTPRIPAPSFVTPRGILQSMLALVMVVVVALSEETIFRGYLILRFRAVTGSAVWAILLSAFVFSLGHGYEGSAGVVTVGFMGVFLGVIYVWRRSLIAPIVIHFLQDFITIVVQSLVGPL